ncbi:MAG TPA: hypothetical protein VGQ99_12405, partial [Tepidisphaeraceae bacterium]|nr:hypothetical protein [Tepidisphaeraceae bacterium]
FGLREVDLRQLQAHNSFICLFTDANEPVFVPYADFEALFDQGAVAQDGQYKVQLLRQEGNTSLYIPRKGRFNVDAFVGFQTLADAVVASRLRPRISLTHCQVQTLIASIGHIKGYDIWVPSNNVCALDWTIADEFELRPALPTGFDRVGGILEEVDIIWVAPGRNKLEGLFEVEHSTPIYSGLLRFNDVLLTEPKVRNFFVVSNDVRRDLFSRQVNRPTFRQSGLAEVTSFLEYANVWDWHERLKGFHEKPT